MRAHAHHAAGAHARRVRSLHGYDVRPLPLCALCIISYAVCIIGIKLCDVLALTCLDSSAHSYTVRTYICELSCCTQALRYAPFRLVGTARYLEAKVRL